MIMKVALTVGAITIGAVMLMWGLVLDSIKNDTLKQ